MSFHVGQKVVCVDAKCRHPKGHVFVGLDGENKTSTGNMGGLTERAIYTVRDITHGGKGVLLQEIFRARIDPGFDASRFRPLIERSTETGMAILRKVADDASKKAPIKILPREVVR